MNTSRVFITGCARNIGQHLATSLNFLIQLRNLFNSTESVICIIENDSTDNTKEILANYKRVQQNFYVFSLDGLSKYKPRRTDRLGYCRNFAVSFAQLYTNIDYFIAVDLDNVLTEETLQAIPKCFEVQQHWDALFANSMPKYYDIWALRSNQLGLTYDCWDAISHDLQEGQSFPLVKEKYVKQYQKFIAPSDNLIPVESAFNGLGIYRFNTIKNCTYIGIRSICEFNRPIDKCHTECCEHVSFHEGMIGAGCKLFIAPFLVVNAQMEHL